MEKILGKYYVHAKHISGVSLQSGKLVEDVNRKTYGRQRAVTQVTLALATEETIEALIVQTLETGHKPCLWITDAPEDKYIICPDAVEKIGLLLNLSTLTGEPLGCGSYKRWAGHVAVEPKFMTGLLIAQGL
jgi:hypothetical protein